MASKNTKETLSISMEDQKIKIRNLIKGVYDIQKLRIATGNRIVQSFNIQMGQAPSTKQDDMEDEAQSMIKKLRAEYKRITDAYISKSYVVKVKKDGDTIENEIKLGTNSGIEKIIKTMQKDENAEISLIKSKLDYELMGTYMSLIETEEQMTKIIDKEVKAHPLWDAFFKDVKGCGPLMSAVCIAYFDIHKARHVSSFWKYAGLDTVDVERPKVLGYDDKGKAIISENETEHVREGRQRKHTETFEYVTKDGEKATKRGLTYNTEVKTKLCGVLGSCFLKSPGSYYEQIYRDYRNRLDNRVDIQGYTAAHKHKMANRYMIKQFVRDLWVCWRALEGYVVTEPYEVAYLGRAPHKYNEYHDRVAKQTKEERKNNNTEE